MKKQVVIATLAAATFLGIGGAVTAQANEISQPLNRGQHILRAEHRLENFEELTLIINGETITITSREQLREIAENYGKTLLEENKNLINFRRGGRAFLESNRDCIRESLNLDCLRENLDIENFDLNEMRGRFFSHRGQRG
ncbi:MAG: hypothetical protein FWE02_00670 [Defluviitaleaceae bacterium]|nr:hypothetical protein [Defluviitaleaceae bacterium]